MKTIPIGVRLVIYSYFTFPELIHHISLVSRRDRTLLIASRILDQERTLKLSPNQKISKYVIQLSTFVHLEFKSLQIPKARQFAENMAIILSLNREEWIGIGITSVHNFGGMAIWFDYWAEIDIQKLTKSLEYIKFTATETLVFQSLFQSVM